MRLTNMYKGLMLLSMVCLIAGFLPASALAGDYQLGYNTNAGDNDYISTTTVPSGKIGKSMSISFRVKATDEDMNNLKVSLLQTNEFQQIEQRGNGDYTVDYYPFEITENTFRAKLVGNVKKGNIRTVTLSANVRRDAQQGYYSIPINLAWDGGSDTDYVNIWISTDTTAASTDDEAKKEGNYFVIGENEPTPRGTYPNVMDYSVNFRNKRSTTVQDVTVSMQMSEDDTKFPFEINDGNYDRSFARIQPNETVSASYSMAIRKKSYSGYYPIKYTITFRLSSEGDLHTEEGTFYVYVNSKNKEDDLREFNANDRSKARLIVDSYHTVPAQIYAGDEFELVLNMKNASASVPASNILFNLESEKVSDSAVFTTESGSSSMVVNSLGAGQSTELRAKFTARAGVDQRSYAITIKEKYDSPEFKNAEESIVVDIPVKEYAKLSTSNIDVMPDTMSVGSESNIMFGINNTGKVILYNVSASFASDSIKPTDAYVGNIKPGATGNVDVMLTGISPTTDDGTVKVTISYEDENGVAAAPVEKELTLNVTEPAAEPADTDIDAGAAAQTAAPSFWSKYKVIIIAGAAAAGVVCIIVVVSVRKKRRAAKEEDEYDEIS